MNSRHLAVTQDVAGRRVDITTVDFFVVIIAISSHISVMSYLGFSTLHTVL